MWQTALIINNKIMSTVPLLVTPTLTSHLPLTWRSLTKQNPKSPKWDLMANLLKIPNLLPYPLLITRPIKKPTNRRAQKSHKSASTKNPQIGKLQCVCAKQIAKVVFLSNSLSLSLSLCYECHFKCWVIVLGLNLSCWVLRIWEFWDVVFCYYSEISIYLCFSLVVSHSHSLSSSLPL